MQIDDVVAPEHARRPVPRERHDGVRIVPGVNEMLHAAPSEVVDDPARQPGRRARLRPELPEVPNAAAVPVEDVRAVEASDSDPALDDDREFAFYRKNTAMAVLRVLGTEP